MRLFFITTIITRLVFQDKENFPFLWKIHKYFIFCALTLYYYYVTIKMVRTGLPDI